MKLSKKQIHFIKKYSNRKSTEQISKDLKVDQKLVEEFLDSLKKKKEIKKQDAVVNISEKVLLAILFLAPFSHPKTRQPIVLRLPNTIAIHRPAP